MEPIIIGILVLLAVVLAVLLIYEARSYAKLLLRLDNTVNGFSDGFSAVVADIVKFNGALESVDQRIGALERDTILIETVIEMHNRALQLNSLDKLLAHAELNNGREERGLE